MGRFITEQTLIRWYLYGFKDEVTGSSSVVPEGIITRAYLLGAKNAQEKPRAEWDMTDTGIKQRMKDAKV